MFQVKNFNSIVASLINNASALSDELTDFNIGSKNRTVLEAVAREIDQFYQNLLKGFYEAVPVSIYKSFNFSRLAASAASGYVSFERNVAGAENVHIPAGTQVKVPNTSKIYATRSDATILSGQFATSAFIVAIEPGTDGNAASDTITELIGQIEGVDSVTNPSGLSNGKDIEDDHERKQRFQQWVNNLARATRKSVEYGAKLAHLKDSNGVVIERVHKALVHEPCIDDNPPGPPGYINVFVWNGVGGASAALRAEVKKVLHGYTDETGKPVPGWKGAGIVAYVYEVVADPVDVSITVSSAPGYVWPDIIPDINEAIDRVFQGLDIGRSLLVSRIVDAVMGVPGVYDMKIVAPLANIDSTWNHIITKGEVIIAELT